MVLIKIISPFSSLDVRSYNLLISLEDMKQVVQKLHVEANSPPRELTFFCLKLQIIIRNYKQTLRVEARLSDAALVEVALIWPLLHERTGQTHFL